MENHGREDYVIGRATPLVTTTAGRWGGGSASDCLDRGEFNHALKSLPDAKEDNVIRDLLLETDTKIEHLHKAISSLEERIGPALSNADNAGGVNGDKIHRGNSQLAARLAGIVGSLTSLEAWVHSIRRRVEL